MNSLVTLDVLVVQSANLAASASVADSHSRHPFLLNSKQANYNLPYAYFLDVCKESGILAGLTTSADIIGPGTCRNYWTSSLGNWAKVKRHAKAFQIFDKFLPVSSLRAAERDLMLSDELIKPFHDVELFDIFFDKLLTYKKFPRYAIPTVSLRSNKLTEIKASLQRLRALIGQPRYAGDFSAKIVLKDRFGASGNFVYKITNNFAARINTLMLRHSKVRFVLQPFVSFEKGFAYKNNRTATDLRLIFHHDRLLQCYVRMAKADDFRCNEHQGGQLEYVAESDIPNLIHNIARKIVTKINKPQSLYALDFVVSNTGKAYFIEGNIGPGIDWDVTKKVNEKMSKQLIRSIVDEFATRIDRSTVLF
jgi:hypothetical protein